MKKMFLLLISLMIFGCGSSQLATNTSNVTIEYQVDITDPTDDLFHVTVLTENLSNENNIYNFASTVPGTYTILDFGRFVKTFVAYDKNGNEIATKRLGTNKWEISDPDDVVKIVYDIEDSFDADYTEHIIFPMAGTGIESDFAVLNTFGVLGYFEGLQSNPIKLRVDYDSDWTLGTALRLDSEGYFNCETYDHLADSPILLGDLTKEVIKVGNIDVEIYVYCPDTTMNANRIKIMAEDILKSADGFIGYSPVSNYAFLFCFMDMETYTKNNLISSGALEHSLSSLYSMQAHPQVYPTVQGTMAHEFLHILTPLFLHSEIIHEYNFSVPTASEHVWLYEGVTEWGSNIMQLRGGLIDHKEYLNDISQKMNTNDRHDPNYSLSAMSLESYTPKGNQAFINFYNKGALTATLLDIKLLELSDGKKGLREVFLSLLKEYGKYKPFSEKEFFKIFVDRTYPEIEQFINDYIVGSKPLPIAEYFNKIGFNYVPEKVSTDTRPTFGCGIGLDQNNNLIIAEMTKEAKELGLKVGDVIKSFNGREFNMQTAREIMMKTLQMKIGDEYEAVLIRDGKELPFKGKLLQRKSLHNFEEVENLSEKQKNLRDIWSKNL